MRERGYVLVTAAMFAVVLTGALGLVVDVGRMYLLKSRLQTRVDAAALAAAVELDGSPQGIVRAAASARSALGDSARIEFPGPEARSVRVTAGVVERLYLMGILGNNQGAVNASATARQVPAKAQVQEVCAAEEMAQRYADDSDRESKTYQAYSESDRGNGRRVALCGGGAVFILEGGATERLGAYVVGSRRRGVAQHGVFVVRLVQ